MDENVQDKEVDKTSPPEKTSETEAPEKFGKEDVAKMVAEATKEAVKEALGIEGRRLESKYQSLKDKEVRKFASQAAKSRKQAESAQGMLASFGSQVSQSNPEMAQNIYAATQAAENRLMREELDASETERLAEEDRRDFMDTMKQTVEDMGIKGDDTRIDWGEDAKTIGDQTKRILSSATKAVKADMSSMEERITKRILQAQEDKVANQRKDEGLDSVDTSAPASSGYSKAGLGKELGGAQNPAEAKQKLDKFIRGE